MAQHPNIRGDMILFARELPPTSAGVPLNRENAGQVDELLETLGTEDLRLSIPHAEGRGAMLEPIRLRKS